MRPGFLSDNQRGEGFKHLQKTPTFSWSTGWVGNALLFCTSLKRDCCQRPRARWGSHVSILSPLDVVDVLNSQSLLLLAGPPPSDHLQLIRRLHHHTHQRRFAGTGTTRLIAGVNHLDGYWSLSRAAPFGRSHADDSAAERTAAIAAQVWVNLTCGNDGC